MAPIFDYDAAQQIYCLSAMSNAVGSMSATQADMQKAMEISVNTKLPQIAGGWRVSWGPCVYSRWPDQDSPPENVCFAAVSDSQKRVVVAVAGTATPAGFDWLDDVNVYESVDLIAWYKQWNTSDGVVSPSGEWWVDAGDMVCSEGTAIGVFNILSNVSPSTAHDSGVLLWQYLKTITSDYTLILTGHSMGGAIVPVLALGLNNASMIGAGKVYTMTSAGPSIGNEAFVNGYKAVFPVIQHESPADYATLNSDLYNHNDIVPQAWSVDDADDRTLQNISSAIYNSSAISKTIWAAIWSVVKIGKGLSELSNVYYRPIPGTPFSKTPPLQLPITSLQDAAHNVLLQHTKYYWRYIGIEKFEDEFEKHVIAQPGVSKPKIVKFSMRRALAEAGKGNASAEKVRSPNEDIA